jgi:hypothetical protein
VNYPTLLLAGAMLIAAAPAPQATPLPPPPPLANPTPSATFTAAPAASPAATPTPSLDDMLGGKHPPKAAPGATPTPPVQRNTLDGVWEIQIQRGPNTQYEHMFLVQKGNTVTGYYLTGSKKKYPLTGTVDADHSVRLVVTMPDESTILLEARVSDLTDMLGMFTDSKERVPFTAAYRPKEKFIDNINASPGGLGGGP